MIFLLEALLWNDIQLQTSIKHNDVEVGSREVDSSLGLGSKLIREEVII